MEINYFFHYNVRCNRLDNHLIFIVHINVFQLISVTRNSVELFLIWKYLKGMLQNNV